MVASWLGQTSPPQSLGDLTRCGLGRNQIANSLDPYARKQI
jgi:hypothetical protein